MSFQDERERQLHFGRSAERATTISRPAPKQIRGHDTVLRAVQGAGTTLYVEKLDGNTKSGILVAFDSWTLTLRTDDGIRRVIYKHDISEFYTRDGEQKAA